MMNMKTIFMKFQSTHPNTRCDVQETNKRLHALNISIHAPQYEVRHSVQPMSAPAVNISIHAPQYEVRHIVFVKKTDIVEFQSTHPNTRCDAFCWWVVFNDCNFNPRTPIRGATCIFIKSILCHSWISIHAPQYEVRRSSSGMLIYSSYFNPRTPIRGATF